MCIFFSEKNLAKMIDFVAATEFDSGSCSGADSIKMSELRILDKVCEVRFNHYHINELVVEIAEEGPEDSGGLKGLITLSSSVLVEHVLGKNRTVPPSLPNTSV